MDLVTTIAVTVLAVAGAIHIVEATWDHLGDRYWVVLLPGGRVHVFRAWYRPGTVVYHPELGRCLISALDRNRGLGTPWVRVWAHLDEVSRGDRTPTATWVPVKELRTSPEDADASG